MKLKFLMTLLFLPLLATPALSREKKDFEKVLKDYGTLINDYSKESHYDKYEFPKNKKFKDFSEPQRFALFILTGLTLNKSLEEMENHWLEELEKAEDMPADPEASKKDVKKYLDSLFELRKTNAVKLEGLIDDFLKKFPKELTEEEKGYLIKSVKDYHDKNKLIKRD